MQAPTLRNGNRHEQEGLETVMVMMMLMRMKTGVSKLSSLQKCYFSRVRFATPHLNRGRVAQPFELST